MSAKSTKTKLRKKNRCENKNKTQKQKQIQDKKMKTTVDAIKTKQRQIYLLCTLERYHNTCIHLVYSNKYNQQRENTDINEAI